MGAGGPETPYIEGALVRGVSAHILARLLVSPSVARALDNLRMPPWVLAELDATRRAIQRAAAAHEALPISADGSAETGLAEIGPVSPHEISTSEASVLLGLSERRVRQLAAGGMGRRVGGRWLLDRGAVRAYGARPRSA